MEKKPGFDLNFDVGEKKSPAAPTMGNLQQGRECPVKKARNIFVFLYINAR